MKTNMRDIRGIAHSEKQFHKFWLERQKQRERRKEKYEKESGLTSEQLKQLEKQGELIEKDPMRYSFLFQLEYLNRWIPDHIAN